ncbi:MAG: iron-containing alcohol dehydrogenase [Candidatus Coproplasma sp.]
MNDFLYYAPTAVYFGKNSEEKLAKILQKYGCRKVLIHYGGESALKSGLITRIKWGIERADIAYCELGGVKPNPRLSLVNEGISLCQCENVDLILAVGGGSVIDSAKAIGLGAANGGDVWDFYSRKREAERCLPIGVVLTLSASGSEMSNSSVITNDYICEKRGLSCDLTRPAFAMLNPDLTVSVSPYQTACGGADIFMHTAERYLAAGGNMKLTDGISEALMTTVISATQKALCNPNDYEARAELMWAGSLSHNGLTGCGTDGGDWVVHWLGHELSALYDAAHGAALTAVWGSWARYVYKNCLNRFHRFAVEVMGVRPNGTREELALKGIDACVDWFNSIGLPTTVSGLGIKPTDDDLRLMARKMAAKCNGVKGSCMALGEEDFYNIYVNALK